MTLCLSGCQVQEELGGIPVMPPAQTDSGGERAIGPVMAPAEGEPVASFQEDDRMVSLWGKEVGEDYQWYRKTGRENGPVYYLYVTDSSGVPIPNLECYMRSNWEDGLRGAEHLRGISMESGLLPVVLSFREAEKNTAELVVIDPISGGQLLTEINLPEQGWRYARRVIWEDNAPISSADRMEISVLFPDGSPASGVVVELEKSGSKALRFSDQDGKAYFPESLLKGGIGELSITVKDYLERFQEGENWQEDFSITFSGSRQYIIMLQKFHD